MTNNYKWSNPREWLDWKRLQDGLTDGEILEALICDIDGDKIQDAFQNEMDADGYFEPEDEATA